MAVTILCLTACGQRRNGAHMEINKDSDSVLVALKKETLGKFKASCRGWYLQA